MRNSIFILIAFAAACTSPTKPTAVCTTDSDCAAWEVRNNIPVAERCYGAPCPASPIHHNIQAMFAGQPEGPVIYLCSTQPREYFDGNRSLGLSRDHYLQYEECPTVPID
jgi:hypothetical protein